MNVMYEKPKFSLHAFFDLSDESLIIAQRGIRYFGYHDTPLSADPFIEYTECYHPPSNNPINPRHDLLDIVSVVVPAVDDN